MIRPTTLAKASTFLTGLALVLSACDSGTSPTGNAAPLTQAEALQVGRETRDEARNFLHEANIGEMLSPRFELPFEAIGVFHGPRGFDTPTGCATLSENPPTDADADGVPDDLTITYTGPACTFTNSAGTATFTKSGTIHIVDLSQTARRAVRFEFGALKTEFVFDGNSFVRQLDGVTQLLADATGFSAGDTTTVHRESTRFGTSDMSKRWAVTFTADAGQAFDHQSDLPSGDLTINGSTSRTKDGTTRTFEVTTPTALHFDSSCSADDRIVSGELDITHTTSTGTTTIMVIWNGCGVDPTVTTTTTSTAT
jgi:hypothetical protein